MMIEQVRTHPNKPEAITVVKRGSLARWTLEPDYHPRCLTSTQTDHIRFNALTVSPDGEMIIIAPADGPIEFRRWDDLSLVPHGSHSVFGEITSLAFSPNERWFAVADRQETISLIDVAGRSVMAEIAGGEWTSSLLFDPTSTLLASACSFQGGGHIRLDQIDQKGHLVPRYELERSRVSTPPQAFVDSLVHLAFSPDGRQLALFETSAVYQNLRPADWRGNIVLYTVETGVVQWQASLDAHITDDQRSLKDLGCPLGFFTELLFVSQTEIACGASHGLVVLYDVVTGRLRRRIDLQSDASVCSLALNENGTLLWVVLTDGKLVVVSLA